MSKLRYYKLSTSSSVFYDPKSKMKVTDKIPSRAWDQTKKIKEAIRSGHIIEIGEKEYLEMMKELPEATRKAQEVEQHGYAPLKRDVKVVKDAEPVKKETPKAPEPDEEEEEEEEQEVDEDGQEEEEEQDDPKERKKLLKELKELVSSKQYKDFENNKSNKEIKAFLEENDN